MFGAQNFLEELDANIIQKLEIKQVKGNCLLFEEPIRIEFCLDSIYRGTRIEQFVQKRREGYQI